MARRSILREEDKTEINLSSMIDCIFILLIFFIVTTVFVEEQGIQVSKPDAAVAPSASIEQEKVVLEIGADDKIRLDGDEIGLADVARVVKAGVLDETTPVVIHANAQATHGVFVGVWDAAKRGGAVALSFSTVH